LRQVAGGQWLRQAFARLNRGAARPTGRAASPAGRSGCGCRGCRQHSAERGGAKQRCRGSSVTAVLMIRASWASCRLPACRLEKRRFGATRAVTPLPSPAPLVPTCFGACATVPLAVADEPHCCCNRGICPCCRPQPLRHSRVAGDRGALAARQRNSQRMPRRGPGSRHGCWLVGLRGLVGRPVCAAAWFAGARPAARAPGVGSGLPRPLCRCQRQRLPAAGAACAVQGRLVIERGEQRHQHVHIRHVCCSTHGACARAQQQHHLPPARGTADGLFSHKRQRHARPRGAPPSGQLHRQGNAHRR
jgi:hypothetical protein